MRSHSQPPLRLIRMVSDSRSVAGTTAKAKRFSPVRASNWPPAKNEKPNFPMPVGTRLVLALGAMVVLPSPSLRARLVNRLNSTGLKGSTTQEGFATAEKSVLVAVDIQLSTLQEPVSEISAASAA